MSESQHTIAGTVLTMPVKVRKADAHIAMFSATPTPRSAHRLQRTAGLCAPAGRAWSSSFIRIVDCDLGQYNEFSTCVMVHPPGSDARGLEGSAWAGTFVHPCRSMGLSPWKRADRSGATRRSWRTSPSGSATLRVRCQRRRRAVAEHGFGRGLPAEDVASAVAARPAPSLEGTFAKRPPNNGLRDSASGSAAGGSPWRSPIAKELASLGLPKRPLIPCRSPTST